MRDSYNKILAEIREFVKRIQELKARLFRIRTQAGQKSDQSEIEKIRKDIESA